MLARPRRWPQEDEPRTRDGPEYEVQGVALLALGGRRGAVGQDDQGPRPADGGDHPARHGLRRQPPAAVPGLDRPMQEQSEPVGPRSHHCKWRLRLRVTSLEDRYERAGELVSTVCHLACTLRFANEVCLQRR